MLNSSPQQLCYWFQLWFQCILPPLSVLSLKKEMFKGLFCREHSVGRQRLRVWSVDHGDRFVKQPWPKGWEPLLYNLWPHYFRFQMQSIRDIKDVPKMPCIKVFHCVTFQRQTFASWPAEMPAISVDTMYNLLIGRMLKNLCNLKVTDIIVHTCIL